MSDYCFLYLQLLLGKCWSLTLFQLNKNGHLTWVQLKMHLPALLTRQALNYIATALLWKMLSCSAFHVHGFNGCRKQSVFDTTFSEIFPEFSTWFHFVETANGFGNQTDSFRLFSSFKHSFSQTSDCVDTEFCLSFRERLMAMCYISYFSLLGFIFS